LRAAHLLREVLGLAAAAVEELGVLPRLRRLHVEEAVVPRADRLPERAVRLGGRGGLGRRLAFGAVDVGGVHRAVDEALQPVEPHVHPARRSAALGLLGDALRAPRLLAREELGRGGQLGRELDLRRAGPLLLALLGVER